ncbi:hypothetical protein JCM9279_004616 [Rhodotorula babjevae]
MEPVQLPTPSPAPPADQLPVLGQRFSSVSSFKLQAYRACRVLGVSPSSWSGTSKRALVQCRLTTLSTEHALNQQGANCTWLVSANNRNCDGEFEVEVDRVCLVHTCPEACRPAYAAEDRPDLERKIATMEERVRADEKRARRADRAPDDPAPPSPTSSSSTMPSSTRTPTGSRKLRRTRPVNYKVPDRFDFDLDEPLEVGSSETLYPRVEKLKDKMSQIARKGAVAKPARGQIFSSSPTLLATMHVYAEQNGFHMWRASNANKLDRVSIACRRNHCRFDNLPTGRCTVQVDAERDDDDSWRIVAVKLDHNHDLDAASDASPAPQRPVKRARHQAPSPQPRQKPLAAPYPATSTPSSSRDPFDEAPARSTPFSTAATPLAAPPRRTDPSSTSTPPSADLVAFLSALYPATDIADKASTLARAGLSTAKDLALLLDVEPGAVQVADDEMRLREGDFARTWSLVDVQTAMREAYGAR